MSDQPSRTVPPPEVEDHLQGDEIRRQVEFYFSDENLPNDAYLLAKCGGAENRPVPIRSICGFPKMRKYRPYRAVVAALRRSIYLDVVDDKFVKRKVPVILDEAQDDPDTVSDAKPKPADITGPARRKGPTSDNPHLTKGLLKPTGFEEWYADPPVTPAEHAADRLCFDPALPIDSRVEAAVQRYAARRKFHQRNRGMFEAWFRYSGWDCGPRQFQGTDARELEGYDAHEIAMMMSTMFPGEGKNEPDKWVVDFTGVAKGFLSSRFPELYELNMANVQLATRIMTNLYNWFLHHSVCPEYTDDILAARAVCGLAIEEYARLIPLHPRLPGRLNAALSTLFPSATAFLPPADEGSATFRASKVVAMSGLAAFASDELFRVIVRDGDGDGWVARARALVQGERRAVALEVVAVEPPGQETRALYAGQNRELRGKLWIDPPGALRCRVWRAPTFSMRDVPKAPRWEPGEVVLRLEEEVLELCFVGMKLVGTIRMLEDGFWWLDELRGVLPSFYTVLLNDLVEKKWKHPRFLRSREERERAEQKDHSVE